MTCTTCEWRPWGTRRPKYGEVRRVRCHRCGRVRDEDPNRPEFGLRRGQKPQSEDGPTRWMDFWSRVGQRFGRIGLPAALKLAAEEVGVDRSTGWRWAHRLDFQSTPKPLCVTPTAWRLLETCVGQFRRGQAARRQEGDVAEWRDDLPAVVSGALDRRKVLLRAITEARLVAAVLAGEDVPSWVDRLMIVTAASSLYRMTKPSSWRALRNDLKVALSQLDDEREWSSDGSLASHGWVGEGKVPGVEDALLRYALQQLGRRAEHEIDPLDRWALRMEHQLGGFLLHTMDATVAFLIAEHWGREQDEPRGRRTTPAELGREGSLWYARLPPGTGPAFDAWLASARSLPEVDRRRVKDWLHGTVLEPTARMLREGLSSDEAWDPVRVTCTGDVIRVTARALNGSAATLEVPPREVTTREGETFFYPAQAVSWDRDRMYFPREGGKGRFLLQFK